ncbi:MAG: tRNA lysidine(34) synthetase TilS, partial [Dehalococcoidia bacterium]|nr:tRNA lysidine(34) synthetase TilS [Dehalococcoidia bacterium]
MRDSSRSVVDRVESAVRDSLRAVGVHGPGVTLVLAVSGGADSLCLLHALHRLSDDHLCLLHVAHLDHMLRAAESQADAAFVATQAAALGVGCTVESRDVASYREAARCSLEEAAREVRYGFLREVAGKCHARAVLTGHTRDDAVETVMLHILRGAGVRGLRGLEPVSQYPRAAVGCVKADGLRLVRPLLGVSRLDTVEYCRALGLEPRDDVSNRSPAYLRNRVRLELLPSMRQLNPRLDDALLRLSAAATEDDDALESLAGEMWELHVSRHDYRVRIDASAFAESPAGVQSRLIFRSVTHLTGDARDVTAEHIAAVRDIAAGAAGRQVDLPSGVVWRRVSDHLIAFVRSAAVVLQPMPVMAVRLPVPGEVDLPGGRLTASLVASDAWRPGGPDIAFLDAERTGDRLFVRRREAGDRFRPLGMAGEKKLQDFFVDLHIAAEDRDAIPVVCNPSHIVWVAGLRIDERARM